MLNKINNLYKEAMLNKNEVQKKVLNTLKAEIKNLEISLRPSGKEMTDGDILALIQKLIKQDKESVEMFKQGNREDLVEATNKEIDILNSLLPEQISGTELEILLTNIIQEVGASSVKDMGKVMGVLKSKYNGQLDMGEASSKIRTLLCC